jgi:hypothetical protein
LAQPSVPEQGKRRESTTPSPGDDLAKVRANAIALANASTRVHSRPPKSIERIDAHRAESRDDRGRETRNSNNDESANERHWISGRHAKQLRLDVPSSHECRGETDGCSGPE